MKKTNKREEKEWIPRTELGKKVIEGKIMDIEKIVDRNIKIKESEIVDKLVPNLDSDLLLIGQAKGKFGGGQRRVFRVTQKTTSEGHRTKFYAMGIVGNHNGIIGLGEGSAGETVPARDKSFRNSKMNIIKIKRGCGSWECGCGEPHSIPFKVRGKYSSAVIELLPAPKGIGLCVGDECKKMLRMAGIRDVWSKTYGQTQTRVNLMKACFEALKKLSAYRLNKKYAENVNIVDGMVEE